MFQRFYGAEGLLQRFNLVWRLDRSDFMAEILLVHLAKLQWTVFLNGPKISVGSAFFTDE